MGLIARSLEEHGISTSAIALVREVAELVKPPRAAFVRFPFGKTLGEAGDAAGQRRVVKSALTLLEAAQAPGTLVDLPYKWRQEAEVAAR